jgi:hypothetical protein
MTNYYADLLTATKPQINLPKKMGPVDVSRFKQPSEGSSSEGKGGAITGAGMAVLGAAANYADISGQRLNLPKAELQEFGDSAPTYNIGATYNQIAGAKSKGATFGEVAGGGLSAGLGALQSTGNPLIAGGAALVGAGAALLGGRQRKKKQQEEKDKAMKGMKTQQSLYNEADANYTEQQNSLTDYRRRLNLY